MIQICTVIDHALGGGIYFDHAWSNIHLVMKCSRKLRNKMAKNFAKQEMSKVKGQGQRSMYLVNFAP